MVRVISKKKPLKTANLDGTVLPTNTSLLVNPSLWSYYKYFCSKCKALWSSKPISSFLDVFKVVCNHIIFFVWNQLIENLDANVKQSPFRFRIIFFHICKLVNEITYNPKWFLNNCFTDVCLTICNFKQWLPFTNALWPVNLHKHRF